MGPCTQHHMSSGISDIQNSIKLIWVSCLILNDFLQDGGILKQLVDVPFSILCHFFFHAVSHKVVEKTCSDSFQHSVDAIYICV